MKKTTYIPLMAVLLLSLICLRPAWAQEAVNATAAVERAVNATSEALGATGAALAVRADKAAAAAENILHALEENADKAANATAALATALEDKSDDIAAATAAIVVTIEQSSSRIANATAAGITAAGESSERVVQATADAVTEVSTAVTQELNRADTPPVANTDLLSAAIAKVPLGTEPGTINPSAPAGFLGIPGAPQVNPIMAFLWAVWVGWIFSTVGAFGGIMANVGHISVFGLGHYANSFGKNDLNKVVTDSIRASNQMLVGMSSFITATKYTLMGRIVLPLAIALGLGSIIGAYSAVSLSAQQISFKDYVGYFGLFVLFLGCYLLYETTPAGQARRKKAGKAAKAFEAASKAPDGGKAQTGVKILGITPTRLEFTFCGVAFSFNPMIAFVGGLIIAAVAGFLGVGGGFLIVPFLTSIAELPMYLAAGTSALAVLISMITGVATFIFGSNTPIYWPLVGVEMVGIVVGSWVGPMTSRYLPDKWLKRLFIVLAFIVGANFVSRGFFNYSLF